METPNGEETIFAAALALPPGERDACLDQACGGDAALRHRVEALLKAHAAGAFLEEPAAAVTAQTLQTPTPISERPGDTIGRYKLLQQIGEGGCGVVYMAEQTEPVQRRVALKIIKLGMDTKQVIARFEAERQALALMDHPNIAKVLDGGATEAGRPYFVMELVRGVKITEYCDHNNLPTRERLDLFMQVCRAIQHAHQKGIIHRDIKPSNILVTINDGVPVPKVIDFGIAKATQGRLTDKTVFTAFEQFIGTPAYVSPEQAVMTSLDIDTRSDIYSLGVLLYELLTGKTPFDTKELLEAGFDAMRRTIQEKEPERPSTKLSTMMEGELTTTAKRRQTESPKLISAVRGDLDWIVMKCLEKDRSRRYETANGLANDLQRHLDQEPVLACPPSGYYRLRKLIRRNKIVVTAGALAMLSLVAGLVDSAWMFAKERKAHQRALAAEDNARKKQHEAEAASVKFQNSEREKNRNLYAAEMALARSAWEDGQLERALDLLRSHIPKRGQEDLRGFEWRFLWGLCQEGALETLTGHGDYVQCLALSPDGRLLASGSGDGIVKLWDVASRCETGALQCSTGDGREVRSLAFLPDGRTLVTAHFSAALKLWDISTGQALGSFGRFDRGQKMIRIFPNGRLLACATSDGRVTLWNLEDRALVGSMQGIETPHPAISVSPDGATLASSSGHRDILLWDVATRQQLGTLQRHIARVDSVQFSPDGAVLASAGADCTVRLWDVAHQRELAVLAGHRVSVFSVSFSPDGGRVASTSIDGLIKLWDFASHAELRTLRGHNAMVNVALFFPDGRVLASASDDRTIKLWDTSSPTSSAMLKGLGGPATDFHFLPDGNTLAILEVDGSVSFWDPASGRQQARLSGTFRGFSDTGRIVFGLRTTGELEFWDSTSRRLLATAEGHTGDNTSRRLLATADDPLPRAFSPDDLFFACADTNGTVRLWEVATGRLQGALPGPTNSVDDLWFPAGTGDLLLGIRRASNQMDPRENASSRELAPEGSRFLLWRQIGLASYRFWNARTGNETEALPNNVQRVRQTLQNGLSLSLLRAPRGRIKIEAGARPANEMLRLLSCLPLSDGKLLLIGGERDIDLWDLDTGHLAAKFKGHGGWVSRLALSVDGRTLASSANDGTLKLWSLGLRKELLAFPGQTAPWSDLALSADGSAVAALSHVDGLVRVFYAPSLSQVNKAEIKNRQKEKDFDAHFGERQTTER